MGKRQSRRRASVRGREFLGEFVRYRCECGRTFEIKDPQSKAEFPGVRLYSGFCPHCGDGVVHGVCEGGQLSVLESALADFWGKCFKGEMGKPVHVH